MPKPQLTVQTLPPHYLTTASPLELRITSRGETSSLTGRGDVSVCALTKGEAVQIDLPERYERICGANSTTLIYRFPTLPGPLSTPSAHTISVEVADSQGRWVGAKHALKVLPGPSLSPKLITGIFVGLYHWSQAEGKPWNEILKTYDDDDWTLLIRSYHAVGIKTIVIQESFRSEAYVGKHSFETTGYEGAAFYPSSLTSRRVPIRCADPIETILAQADALAMSVFVPLGLYAWFDFTPASCEWHKRVATELFDRYGHHPSFYGWYISEEIHGDLGPNESRRQELVAFMAELRKHCYGLDATKPLLLASNCHRVTEGGEYYDRLFESLDILMPFGFNRMPPGDLRPQDAAEFLLERAGRHHRHVWLDLEIFRFGNHLELLPRPFFEVANELDVLDMFEQVIAYQGPGLMTPRWHPKPLGSPDSIKLYEDYRRYYLDMTASAPTRADDPMPTGKECVQ